MFKRLCRLFRLLVAIPSRGISRSSLPRSGLPLAPLHSRAMGALRGAMQPPRVRTLVLPLPAPIPLRSWLDFGVAFLGTVTRSKRRPNEPEEVPPWLLLASAGEGTRADRCARSGMKAKTQWPPSRRRLEWPASLHRASHLRSVQRASGFFPTRPHGAWPDCLATPPPAAVAFGLQLLPTCSAEDRPRPYA